MGKTEKFVLPSQLSEKQIEADVATYLGWCTPSGPHAPFRLYDVDEQITGADKVYDMGGLIYLQFKKSTGLQQWSGGGPRQLSALGKIRKYRADHDLQDAPTLYFKLREMAKTAVDFQHNILLRHNRPPTMHAVYVAPLALDPQRYGEILFNSSTRTLGHPFYYLDYRIHHERWTDIFRAIPFLRAHVSIPPHEQVSTHEHYFSFGTAGDDIAWHSPETLPDRPSRLSDFFADFLRQALNEEGGGLVPIDQLPRLLPESEITLDAGEAPLGMISRYGRWLHETYQIRQFVFLTSMSRITEWQRVIDRNRRTR